mmetsp:Transcript_80108/g.202639  ORF Transcript_80108/g.202639 Transcript_80108/m.202639 type:complete len:242 (-) Transcript_80108:10-735(-)
MEANMPPPAAGSSLGFGGWTTVGMGFACAMTTSSKTTLRISIALSCFGSERKGGRGKQLYEPSSGCPTVWLILLRRIAMVMSENISASWILWSTDVSMEMNKALLSSLPMDGITMSMSFWNVAMSISFVLAKSAKTAVLLSKASFNNLRTSLKAGSPLAEYVLICMLAVALMTGLLIQLVLRLGLVLAGMLPRWRTGPLVATPAIGINQDAVLGTARRRATNAADMLLYDGVVKSRRHPRP